MHYLYVIYPGTGDEQPVTLSVTNILDSHLLRMLHIASIDNPMCYDAHVATALTVCLNRLILAHAAMVPDFSLTLSNYLVTGNLYDLIADLDANY